MKLAPWPYFADDEVDAAADVLRSGKVNYWTGHYCKDFEQLYADYFGTRYAICVANGTLALELALVALGIQAGDEVIVPCKTFMATASSVVARGATPVVADVDLDSQALTVEMIEAQRTAKTKAIIVVHLGGYPADMPAIMAYAKQHNLWVIEDCAQSHGASIDGKMLGSFGHINAFSFCQDKIMTTGGEGGMVTTSDETLWKKAWAYKDHGKGYDVVYNTEHPPGFRWLHENFGSNFRMTEMQAAIGIKQLEKLPQWTELRNRNAMILYDAIKDFAALRTPLVPENMRHAYYKFYTFVVPENLKPGWDRDRIMQALNDRGIFCQVGSCSEIYLEEAFDANHLKPGQRLDNAQQLTQTSLMFLVHPTLTTEMMQKMADNIVAVMHEASC